MGSVANQYEKEKAISLLLADSQTTLGSDAEGVGATSRVPKFDAY